MEYTKYAAVGHFKCHRTLDGKKYPVVIVGRKEYMLDVQEMTVWSSLAWRILSRSQIAEAYLKLTRGLSFTSRRTLDDCIDRLENKSNALRIRNVRSPENAEMMAAARNGKQSSSDSCIS